ncbi:hypothetical protein Aduo_008664 [Ancylostoma duodenale]
MKDEINAFVGPVHRYIGAEMKCAGKSCSEHLNAVRGVMVAHVLDADVPEHLLVALNEAIEFENVCLCSSCTDGRLRGRGQAGEEEADENNSADTEEPIPDHGEGDELMEVVEVEDDDEIPPA